MRRVPIVLVAVLLLVAPVRALLTGPTVLLGVVVADPDGFAADGVLVRLDADTRTLGDLDLGEHIALTYDEIAGGCPDPDRPLRAGDRVRLEVASDDEVPLPDPVALYVDVVTRRCA